MHDWSLFGTKPNSAHTQLSKYVMLSWHTDLYSALTHSMHRPQNALVVLHFCLCISDVFFFFLIACWTQTYAHTHQMRTAHRPVSLWEDFSAKVSRRRKKSRCKVNRNNRHVLRKMSILLSFNSHRHEQFSNFVILCVCVFFYCMNLLKQFRSPSEFCTSH